MSYDMCLWCNGVGLDADGQTCLNCWGDGDVEVTEEKP